MLIAKLSSSDPVALHEAKYHNCFLEPRGITKIDEYLLTL